MPTYEYRCDNCGKNFDVVQSFHDEPLTACPTCGEPVKKVFGSVGIVFKGSGFYKTDSRSGGSASRTADTGASGSNGDGGSSSDATPAATPAAASSDSSPSGGDKKTSAPAKPATDKGSSKAPAPTT